VPILQARTVADKSEAIKAVEAFSAVLAIGQQLAAPRAPLPSKRRETNQVGDGCRRSVMR
jgi:hypothetical protein